MRYLRWTLVIVAMLALVGPVLAAAAEKEVPGLFTLERPGACAGKDEKPQTTFADLFGDKPSDSCSGWCNCSYCECSGSISCCGAGCGACWEYRDDQGLCGAAR